MSKLPITEKEYNTSAIISELISKIKEKAENNQSVTDVHFRPTFEGYEITFNCDGAENLIAIKKNNQLFKSYVTVSHKKEDKAEKTFKVTDGTNINSVAESIL